MAKPSTSHYKYYQTEYIKTLFQISAAVAVAPFYHFQKQRMYKPKCIITYSVFVQAITILLSVVSVYGKSKFFFQRFSRTEEVLRSLVYISMTISNIFTMINSTIYLKRWERILKTIRNMDVISEKLTMQKHHNKLRISYRREIIHTIITLILHGCHIYVSFTYKINQYELFVFGRLQSLHIHVLVLLMTSFINVIRLNLLTINDSLEKNMNMIRKICNVYENIHRNLVVRDLNLSYKLYMCCVECARLFNKIFGLLFLTLFLMSFTAFLDLANEIVLKNMTTARFSFSVVSFLIGFVSTNLHIMSTSEAIYIV